MLSPTFNPNIHNHIIKETDYFRLATMGLGIQKIIQDKIEGSFAEAGVFRGETSRIIHMIAPLKKFYLFDTFEGFPEKDLEGNLTDKRFKDTSMSLVRKNTGFSDNVILKAGYIPDTFIGLEAESFAFVLLDLDLYIPTKKSLEFFYPRLARGGYLFIHDYNNAESNFACKRAADEFMLGKPEMLIEIADIYGSVCFRKLC